MLIACIRIAFAGTVFTGTVFTGTAFAGTAFTGTAFMGTAFTGTAFTLIACILLFYHYIMDLSTVKCRIGAKFLAFIPQNHPKIQKSCRLDPAARG